MREVITTGKTVEEAVADALAQLGLTEDEVTVEILDLPQKKLFKTVPARVKVTSDADAEQAQQAADAAAEAKSVPAAPKAAQRAPEKAPIAHSAPSAKPAAPAQRAPEADAPAPVLCADEPETPLEIASNPKLVEAAAYLQDLCAKMDAPNVVLSAVQQGEALILKVEGEGAGGLIGHRGETMEALSYLTSLVANRSGGDYLKIGLDINHYRQKREINLIALAQRIGAKVAKSGRSQTLEPMNPYERRIIHSAVGSIAGVKSESMGEGANRRVCILSTAPGAIAGGNRPFRQADRRGPRPGAQGKAPFRKDGPRPPHRDGDFERKSNVPEREFADKPREAGATPTAPKRTETINDSAALPLYGKIEL
ncbi:MAG: RNA-binding cell elongation regulator Jag/EloR [Ruthenibacterium sp.]